VKLNSEIRKAQGFFLKQQIEAKKRFEELMHHAGLLEQIVRERLLVFILNPHLPSDPVVSLFK